ncbi:BglII/BstYI family type II restriction endonuclease [Sulfurivermis fontis]|uniref:BglII/BstYI family type II restriction endonuclease n=1 Tax=Sulfurivermis fontis TaxID=1972068 RepID=UPI000FDAC3CC|nr:BglII/BstYI family type II restriction endonuclease [Sulfurivermis fontis]
MRIVDTYSHLNGEEFLIARKPVLYEEIKQVIADVDAATCRTKTSKEKTMPGKKLFSPPKLNKAFESGFHNAGWYETRYQYYVTTNRDHLEKMVGLPLQEQKQFLVDQNAPLIKSYKQTDFVKDGVAVEVQFGKYAFVAFDLFVKHLLFYSGGLINVGVEILPMKSMAEDPTGGRLMSTGIAYFEGEVYNVLRHGRTSPPVPLLIIGIAPD